MRQLAQGVLAFALMAALGACGGQEQSDGASGQAAGDTVETAAADSAASAANAAPAAFMQCRSCHAVEPGKHLIGPSLAGIFGTKAGEIGGYNFSTAMKESGLTWDEATLDSFLKSPREVIPGTKMTYPGLKNDAKRAEVVAYMKTLK